MILLFLLRTDLFLYPLTYTTNLYDKLTKLGIPIIQTTSQTIKNLTNKRTNNKTTSHAGVYSIPC